MLGTPRTGRPGTRPDRPATDQAPQAGPQRYWHSVNCTALERPVVEGLAGSRIHHWE